jgi:hypothetical protein
MTVSRSDFQVEIDWIGSTNLQDKRQVYGDLVRILPNGKQDFDLPVYAGYFQYIDPTLCSAPRRN